MRLKYINFKVKIVLSAVFLLSSFFIANNAFAATCGEVISGSSHWYECNGRRITQIANGFVGQNISSFTIDERNVTWMYSDSFGYAYYQNSLDGGWSSISRITQIADGLAGRHITSFTIDERNVTWEYSDSFGHAYYQNCLDGDWYSISRITQIADEFIGRYITSFTNYPFSQKVSWYFYDNNIFTNDYYEENLITCLGAGLNVNLGTVNVSSNASDSFWTIKGPATIIKTGYGTSATYTNMPPGDYTITWGRIGSYGVPASEKLTLSSGGSITFEGNYMPIHISSNVSTSWTITSPNISIPIVGSGSSLDYIMPAGDYTIVWDPVFGYVTPASEKLTLSSGGSITFKGDYIPGSFIYISSNVSTSWTISSPNISTPIVGSGSSSAYTVPAGDYTIVWDPVFGYVTPASEKLTLSSGGNITFEGNYMLRGVINVSSNIPTSWTISSDNGIVLWRKTSNPSLYSDIAYSVAVDSTGIYVAGVDFTPGNYQWRIEKRSLIDDNNLVIWAQTSNPSASSDIAASVAVDSTGIYVAGVDFTPGNYQWRIEKRNLTTGALVSSFGTNGAVTSNPSAGSDIPTSIAVDSTGIYVAGVDSTFGSRNDQWRIEKRDLTTGALVSSFGTNGAVTSNPSASSDIPTSIAVDSTGIYVAGYDFTPGNQQWRIEKITDAIKDSGSVKAYIKMSSATYTITWGDVSGYVTPASKTLPLPPGGTIDFYGDYQLVGGNPQITLTSVNPNLPAGCSASGTSLTPVLVWTYSDPDGDLQAKYQVIIKQGLITIYDSGQVSSSSSFYDVTFLANLNYNNTYTWTIQVWDSKGGISGLVSGMPFTTVKHDLPYSLFKYFPTAVVKNSNVQFCSVKTEGDACASQTFTETYCPGSICVAWLWSGPGANPPFSFVSPTNSASKNPIITFSAGSDVSLRVTDGDGYYCSASQAINVGGAALPLPTFRER